MSRQGNKTKLPAKEAAASKVVGRLQSTVTAGMIVIYQGERIVMKQVDYGSFKKLLQAAIKLQNKDAEFTWTYYDTLPQ